MLCRLHDGGPALLHGSGRCILLTVFSLFTGAYCDTSLVLTAGAGLSSTHTTVCTGLFVKAYATIACTRLRSGSPSA